MAEHCKECGKEMGWLDRIQICKGYCQRCSKEMLKHCRICGKKIKSFPSFEGDFVMTHDFTCKDCWSKGKKHTGERSCDDCTHCVTNVSSERGGLFGELRFEKKHICSKFGFDVSDRLHFARECTSHLTRENYEQKCLRGELDSDSATCPYCQAVYDRVKQARCPNCGAFPKGR